MAKKKRAGLSQKTRFEVFKRDKFTCQYCGGKAPDVILRVDHIKPVATGGDNNLMNLVTSCDPCNSGKGPRELDDQSSLEKQRRMLEELNERREQLEMMLTWREGLLGLADQQTDAAVAAIQKHLSDSSVVSDSGREEVARWVKRFSLQHVLSAVDSAAELIRKNAKGEIVDESWDRFWDQVPKRAGVYKRSEAKPYLRDLYYIRGILRKTLSSIVEWRAFQLLEEAHTRGASIDALRSRAYEGGAWYDWENDMVDWIDTLPRKDGA